MNRRDFLKFGILSASALLIPTLSKAENVRINAQKFKFNTAYSRIGDVKTENYFISYGDWEQDSMGFSGRYFDIFSRTEGKWMHIFPARKGDEFYETTEIDPKNHPKLFDFVLEALQDDGNFISMHYFRSKKRTYHQDYNFSQDDGNARLIFKGKLYEDREFNLRQLEKLVSHSS